MDASWGQQTVHPAMFQQQGQPTHAQALLEQHDRAAAQQAAQQQSQRQTMAALSAQPPSWGMPQQSTSAQMANPAPGATSQGQQPWGMTMPQQGTSAQTAQTASHAMFGAMQAQQASAMHSLMAQQGAMPHHLPTQSAQPSGQQLFPQASHFPTPSPTANPLANLFAQQQHTTPTFSMPSTTSNPQSNTTAEAAARQVPSFASHPVPQQIQRTTLCAPTAFVSTTTPYTQQIHHKLFQFHRRLLRQSHHITVIQSIQLRGVQHGHTHHT